MPAEQLSCGPFDAALGLGHRRFTPVGHDERDVFDPVDHVVLCVADDCDDGLARSLGDRLHATDNFAAKALLVEKSFTGDDQISGIGLVVQVQFVGDQVESGHQLSPERDECTGETTSGTAPGDFADVKPVVLQIHLGETLESTDQHRHLSRGRAFLRPEDRRCIDEGRGHIAGDQQLDTPQPLRGTDRAERTQSPVGGRRTAEADDDLLDACVESLIDQLPGSLRRGGKRIVVLGSTCQRQPRCGGHLDHCGFSAESPVGLDRFTEGTGDERRTIRSAEHLQRAFSAIGHTDLDAVVTELPARVADGLRDLGCRRGASELVDRSQHPHVREAIGRQFPRRAAGQRRVVAIPDRLGSVSIMSVTVRIPTTMRPLSGGSSTVKVDGTTLSEVLTDLNAQFPGFDDRLFDETGALRKFVNVFVADDDVRYLDGLDTVVPDGETVSIIPAVAGG